MAEGAESQCTKYFCKTSKVSVISPVSFSCKSSPSITYAIVWLPRHLLMKFTSEFAQARSCQGKSWLARGQARHSGQAPPPWLRVRCRAADALRITVSHECRYFLLRLTFHPPTTYLFSLSFVLE